MNGLRWLHLSDLHRGQPGEQTRWATAKEPFLADLRMQCRKFGPPHFVVVTGDLAFSGQKREYESVRLVFDEIDAATEYRPLWITVPGNHDLRWPTRGDATAKGLKSYDEDPVLRRAAHGPSHTQRFLRKHFSEYDRFFRTLIVSDWQRRTADLRLDWTFGSLPGDFALRFSAADFRVGIVGINSAFLQLDDGVYEGLLCVDAEQLPADLLGLIGDCDVALLLLHHPPSWLTKRSRRVFEQDIFPPGRFLACLFGHLHGHRVESIQGSSAKSRLYVQGLSLFGLEHVGQQNEQRATGYGFYTLTRLAEGLGQLNRRVRTAHFLDDGMLAMIDDPTTGPAGHMFQCQLPTKNRLPNPVLPSARLSPPPTVENPFWPRGRITDPKKFIGRRKLLQQLLAELSAGMSRTIVGPAQAGKSSVLSVVCALLSEKHVTSVYLNLQLVNDDGDFFDALCHQLGLPACRGYRLERQLQGRKIVLCLDEVERLRNDRFPIEIREQLRGLADGADAPLTLLLATRHPLSELFPDAIAQTSPLYNLCPTIELLPFSAEECRALIADRLAATPVVFSDTEVADLIHTSGGHLATLLSHAADLFNNHKTA